MSRAQKAKFWPTKSNHWPRITSTDLDPSLYGLVQQPLGRCPLLSEQRTPVGHRVWSKCANKRLGHFHRCYPSSHRILLSTSTEGLGQFPDIP
jgi:hypothetical protein